jgi:hypothetical protein
VKLTAYKGAEKHCFPDPKHWDSDPYPFVHSNADPDANPSNFHFVADPDLRILLLIKEVPICHHWSIDPPRLHCERPGPP